MPGEAAITEQEAVSWQQEYREALIRLTMLYMAGTGPMANYLHALAEGSTDEQARAAANTEYGKHVATIIKSGLFTREQLGGIYPTFDPERSSNGGVVMVLSQHINFDEVFHGITRKSGKSVQ